MCLALYHLMLTTTLWGQDYYLLINSFQNYMLGIVLPVQCWDIVQGMAPALMEHSV